MNDIKKIVFTYNHKDDGTVEFVNAIIFKNNGEPITESYDREKHLAQVSEFIGSSISDPIDALSNGAILVVSVNDKKSMDALAFEVIEETAKNLGQQTKLENQESSNKLALSKEDEELAEYFRIKILRDRGQLPPVGLNRIKELAENNERVAALEEARERLNNGALSQEEYDRIHDTYRAQLKEAIEKLAAEREKAKAAEPTEEKEEVKKLSLSKEDEELAEYFRIKILRDKGQLPPVGLNRIKELAENNERVAALEEARERLNNGALSQEEYDRIHDTYRAQLAEAIKNASIEREKAYNSPAIKNDNGNVSVPIQENSSEIGKESVQSNANNNESKNKIGNNVVNSSVANSNDSIDCKKIYIISHGNDGNNKTGIESMVIFRNNGEPIIEEYDRERHLNYIKDAIEAAGFDVFKGGFKKAVKQGLISVVSSTDKKSMDDLKKEILQEQIENYGEQPENVLEDKNDKVKKLTLSKEDEELAEYFRAKILRDRGQLPPTGLNRIKELAKNNERVAALEEAREKLNNGTLSQEEYDRINDTYRAQLAKAITDANNQFNQAAPGTAPSPAAQQTNPGTASNPAPRQAAPGVAPSPAAQQTNPGTASNPASRQAAPGVAPSPTPRQTNPGTKQNSIPGIKLNKNPKKRKVKGDIKTGPGEETVVKGTKVKVTSKWKKLVAWIAGIGATIAAALGITALINKNKGAQPTPTPPVQHLQTVTPTPSPSPAPTVQPTQNPDSIIDVDDVISDYDTYMKNMTGKGIPQKTLDFLKQGDVMNFMKKYNNESQLKEVISALCYGYETNTLAMQDGNFRLSGDGETYLRAFTNDFLCAKVVVNNYTPEEMLAVFGNTNITYEQIMDGFKGFHTTVAVYGTTATETLPFRYVTNGNSNSTSQLEGLFNKLAVVNQNRNAGTLNSNHTDDFIAAVDEFFVQNDQSLGLTEGTKTLAAAMVDSYMYMQANVSNGEALYLHEDRGLAKAGLNLQEVDGTFAIVNKDGTAYEFTSLLNVINHSYADNDLVNSNCLTEKQILLENINEMHRLSKTTATQNATAFANLLHQNGLHDYAVEISKGNYSQDLLDKIEDTNPALSSDIDSFQASMKTATSEYIPFQTTVDGVDELLGIKGLKNDISKLINVRREAMYLYNNYDILSGNRYTDGSYSAGYDGSFTVPPTKVETNVTKEKVDYEDLTDEEKKVVDEQIAGEKEKEEERNKAEKENAEKVAQEVADGLQNGSISEEEARKSLEDAGIEVDDDFFKTIEDIKDNNENVAKETDDAIAEKNKQAQEEAARRRAEEQKQQEKERLEQEELISQSGNANSDVAGNSPELDQTDPGRVDTDIDEQPYVSSSNDTREKLNQIKAELEDLSVDFDDVNLDEIQTNDDLNVGGPTL